MSVSGLTSGLSLNQRAIRSLITQLQQLNYHDPDRIISELSDYDSIQVMNTKLLAYVLIILDKYEGGIILDIYRSEKINILVPGFPNEEELDLVSDAFTSAKTNTMIRERLRADIVRYAIGISNHRAKKLLLAQEARAREEAERVEEEIVPGELVPEETVLVRQ